MWAVLLLLQRIVVETPDMNHPPGLPDPRHKLVVKGCQSQEPLGRQIKNEFLAMDKEWSGFFPGEEVEGVPRVGYNTFLAQKTLREGFFKQ